MKTKAANKNGHILLALGSAQRSIFPRFYSVLTLEPFFPRNQKEMEHLLKTGRARINEQTGDIEVTMAERPEPKVLLTGSVAKGWPDLIAHDASAWGRQVLVSQRVIDGFKMEGISGFNAQPVMIEKRGLKKSSPAPPQYHLVSATGKITMEVPQVHSTDKQAVSAQQLWEAWDGSDIFSEGVSEYTDRLFCSERVFHLAIRHEWINFAFQPLTCFDPYLRKSIEFSSGRSLQELVKEFEQRCAGLRSLPGE
jgi:hypothetical protein